MTRVCTDRNFRVIGFSLGGSCCWMLMPGWFKYVKFPLWLPGCCVSNCLAFCELLVIRPDEDEPISSFLFA